MHVVTATTDSPLVPDSHAQLLAAYRTTTRMKYTVSAISEVVTALTVNEQLNWILWLILILKVHVKLYIRILIVLRALATPADVGV